MVQDLLLKRSRRNISKIRHFHCAIVRQKKQPKREAKDNPTACLVHSKGISTLEYNLRCGFGFGLEVRFDLGLSLRVRLGVYRRSRVPEVRS